MNASDTGHTWALVLAAGDGRRLHSLTRTAGGTAVPKQYCSLDGGPTLLDRTLARARRLVAAERIVTIVATDHEAFWRPALAGLPRRNVVVQPRNRGTGNGILLPLLAILDRDPDARIVVLPSDHYVRAERVLEARLRQALRELGRLPRELVLLGIEPDELDPELGYIQPGAADGPGLNRVTRFVEKPAADVARDLIGRGGLWNSFIMAARGDALLDFYATRFPDVLLGMVAALRSGAAAGTLDALYAALPDIDFSRHVIGDREARLRVLAVPACGWTDLGTPARVARCIAGLPDGGRQSKAAGNRAAGVIPNLALRHRQLAVAAGA